MRSVANLGIASALTIFLGACGSMSLPSFSSSSPPPPAPEPGVAPEMPATIRSDEIVAVGPGGRDEAGKLIPIDLKVGDRVLFGKWSGTEVKIDGQDLLIMKESDVMGVVNKTKAAAKAA